ncbi:transcription initiation factor IIB family protein [Natronococcus wangiae]|uniref:hypothetical protein n=1 Tax=Natronococcus wangiae TaxID=3068275 RepID=UPI00273DEA62|nr:hypothetical protein [Natronococcus sp. AD5]
MRANAIEQVLETLDTDVLDGGAYLQCRDVARHLMEIADEVPIGAGTPRLTVAAAAVYRADRVLGGEFLTMQQVADAVSAIVETSKDKINRYSAELREEYRERAKTDAPSVLRDRGRITVQ